jgi:hypothetical protein
LEKLTKANQASNQTKVQAKEPKFFELKEGVEYFGSSRANGKKNSTTNEILKNEKLKKLPLFNRLEYANAQNESKNSQKDETLVFRSDSYGNKQMTFLSKKV